MKATIENRVYRLECEVRDLKTRLTRIDGIKAGGHDARKKEA